MPTVRHTLILFLLHQFAQYLTVLKRKFLLWSYLL